MWGVTGIKKVTSDKAYDRRKNRNEDDLWQRAGNRIKLETAGAREMTEVQETTDRSFCCYWSV
jgi:hypothetical protein